MIDTISRVLHGYQYKMLENKYAEGEFMLGILDYCEDYIGIVIKNQLEIYEVHRNNRMLIIKTYNKIHAGVYASVLWLRMFRPRNYSEEINKIYDFAKLNKRSMIDDFLFSSLNSKYFFIGYENEKKICLIKEQEDYSVRYYNIKIVENADMTQGYIALFNYAKMLEFVSILYDELIYKIDESIEKNNIIFLYLFGEIKRK